jgi:hypothetical protein
MVPGATAAHSASLRQGSRGCSSGFGGFCGSGAGWHTLMDAAPTPAHDALPPHSFAVALHCTTQPEVLPMARQTEPAPQSAFV